MFALIISFALLNVLYGLAWHDEPAHEPTVVRRTNPKQARHE
jgi:hypothetical protein